MNSRTSLAQREEVIRRTVYVSDIDHQVRRIIHSCTFDLIYAFFYRCVLFHTVNDHTMSFSYRDIFFFADVLMVFRHSGLG